MLGVPVRSGSLSTTTYTSGILQAVAATTRGDVESAVELLGLRGRPVCVHSSLRSFGPVHGGAPTVVDALLDAATTVLVPTFSWETYGHPPEDPQRFQGNGVGEAAAFGPKHQRVFSPTVDVLDHDMGVIPRRLLERPGRRRGDHPLCSFAARGPLAESLVHTQNADDVFAPLRELVRHQGSVLLMGVELTSMTLLHLAEQEAGRAPFRRWALDEQCGVVPVAVGGCSAGFDNFEPHLSSKNTTVGESTWRAFDASSTLVAATEAIRGEPKITKCSSAHCARCRDAIAGGPITSA